MRVELLACFRASLRQALLASTLLTTASAQCLYWGSEFSPGSVGEAVYALCSFNDGSGQALFVGGKFTTYALPNPIPSAHIAKWDGSQWHGVGQGVNGDVAAIGTFDDGSGAKLFIGGAFSTGGIPTIALNRIARWNGVTLEPVGGGLVGGGVYEFAVWDDGAGPGLYVAGALLGARDVPGGPVVGTRGISKWDGTHWSGVGGGTGGVSWPVSDLCVFDDGSGSALFASGSFSTAGGQPAASIAKWDGAQWSPLGAGLYSVRDMLVFDDGSGPALYVLGSITSDIVDPGILRWNGSSWTIYQHLAGALKMITYDDGGGAAIYVAGYGLVPGPSEFRSIARWDVAQFTPLGNGVDGVVYALAVHETDSGRALFVGGDFDTSGAHVVSKNLAVWHGCSQAVETFCFGDGSVAVCPCSNYGATGHGCQNALGTGGAQLTPDGTSSPDTLVFTESDAVPNALTIIFQGDRQLHGIRAFGDGLRCTGGNLLRLYVKTTDANGQAVVPGSGDSSVSVRASELGDTISAGAVRFYQAYHRDPSPSFCAAPTGDVWNASNGVRVVW